MNDAWSPALYRRPGRIIRLIRSIESSRPYMNMERALYFTESMQKSEGQPLVLRWARALVHTLKNIPVVIGQDDRLVGRFGEGRYGIFYPELEGRFLEDPDFAIESFSISPCDLEKVRKHILPYWHGKTFHEAFEARLPEQLRKLLYIEGDPAQPAFIVQETATVRHALQWALDYDKILRRGFRGIAEDAEKKRSCASTQQQKDFYTAVIELCAGIKLFAERFSRLAEEQAPASITEERREELLGIAERCRRIPWEPAASFIDGLQAQWFTQLISRLEAEYGGGISNGRMDQYLWELYRQDRDSGELSEQKTRELLDEFWCLIAHLVRLKPSPTGSKIYEDFAHWEFTTIGGQCSHGGDATNELSFLILRSAAEFPLDYPYLGVRLHKDISQEFLREICHITQQYGKSPVFLNDETITRRQIHNGATKEEALDYCGSGFSEVRLINKDTYLTGATWLNLPAVLEMAMKDGFCSANPSYRTGLSTGPADNFKSFSQFMTAFELQLMNILNQTFQMQALLEQLRMRHIASPLLSSLHDLCMKHGMDISAGTVPEGRSIGCFLGIVGFATVVDSLAAINTLVFRQKKLTFKQLLEVLDSNFEGQEYVRQLCLACPKYGERNIWVDELGKRIDRLLLTRAHSEINSFGGRGEIFYVPVKAYIAMGRVSGATPDGRFAGRQFSFGTTPSPSIAPQGPTVALASEEETQNPAFCSLGARVMQTMLLPRHVCGSIGLDTLMSVLQTWCRHEHWFLQLQVLSPSELTVLRNSLSEYNNLFGNVPGFNTQGYAFPSAAFSHKCPLQTE